MKEKERKELVYDRYSVVFVIMALCVIISALLIKNKSIKWASVPLAVSIIPFAYLTLSSGRIRRNDYTGEILYKRENDCGLSIEPKKHIDGIYLKGKYYKTANGTDIKIDKTGNVKPVGFGSKMINSLSGAGYLNEAPDECWK